MRAPGRAFDGGSKETAIKPGDGIVEDPFEKLTSS